MFNALKVSVFLLLLVGLAHPGSVNFDFRFEWDSSSYNNAAKAAGSKASSQFLMRTGRVDFKGNLNKDISYRLRWGIDHDGATAQHKTDNFSTQVDYAYVQDKVSEDIWITLGKFASELGSIEGNMSSPDIYLPSQAYAALSTNDFLYVSGAKLTAAVLGQEVSLYVVNQSDSQSIEQTKLAYGLVYKGKFLNSTLFPNLGYFSDEKQGMSTDVKMTTNISSAGVKWDPKPYYINLDYIIFAQKNVSAVDVKDTITTLLFDAGYDFEDVIPKFKYEMTTKKNGSVKEQYDGVAVGVEFKPYPQDIFRYHVMVTQTTIKPESGDSRFEQHFLVGTRIYGDFLK
tara:strand:- start:98146 stop:99171 length:1026 start_codon:yes stop_codon:yes gene_type:complete